MWNEEVHSLPMPLVGLGGGGLPLTQPHLGWDEGGTLLSQASGRVEKGELPPTQPDGDG